MSEYQYYEFEAIDKPLTDEEQQAVSRLSSRVAPHPYRAEFTYSYSDLPADPKQLVGDYYDAMFYIANWGSTRLMFRFPKNLVDIATWQQYCTEDAVTLTQHADYVILDIDYHDEDGGGWLEEQSYLRALIPLRQELLDGDHRLLYLAWLLATTYEYGYEDDVDVVEPPVPAGLKRLSPALQQFVEVFELDEQLVTVAAEESAASVSTMSEEAIQSALEQVDRATLTTLLLGLYQDEKGLSAKLRQLVKPHLPAPAPLDNQPQRRTLIQLEQLAQEQAEQVERQKQADAERERVRRLEELAPREEEVWQEIEQLLTKTTARNYDQATEQLKTLHELARHQNKEGVFKLRINQLAEQYARRKSFIQRLETAKLI